MKQSYKTKIYIQIYKKYSNNLTILTFHPINVIITIFLNVSIDLKFNNT